MSAPAIDLTDLLDFDVDDAASATVAEAAPSEEAPAEVPQGDDEPVMTFELEDDDEDQDDEPVRVGTLMTKRASEQALGAQEPRPEPMELGLEDLCLIYDADQDDTCSVVIEDEDEDDPRAEQVVTSERVVAFNGGRPKADLTPPGNHADLANDVSLHGIEAHRFHLVGDALDAVHMLLRSQIPEADRAAQPDCAAAVIKAHHDLRFWEPLLDNRRFKGHVSDFEENLSRLKAHRPDASRAALWQLWKSAHDGLLALLPEEKRLRR